VIFYDVDNFTVRLIIFMHIIRTLHEMGFTVRF
jgi:hypothetical protein